MIDTVTAAKIAAAGCKIRRVDCGLGPTDLWEFIDAEGDNPSGQTWTTEQDAAAYGAGRIDAGLETDAGWFAAVERASSARVAPPDVIQAIREVVAYDWSTELSDYLAQDAAGQEGHIFKWLQTIAEWLDGDV